MSEISYTIVCNIIVNNAKILIHFAQRWLLCSVYIDTKQLYYLFLVNPLHTQGFILLLPGGKLIEIHWIQRGAV